MSDNHFMPIKDVSKETGISLGQLYALAREKEIETKEDESGFMQMSLDAAKAHGGRRRKARGNAAPAPLKRGRYPQSSRYLKNQEKLREFAEAMLKKNEKTSPWHLMKEARKAGITTTHPRAVEILQELRGSTSKIESTPVRDVSPPEHARILAWWNSTILPSLHLRGIHGVSWQLGGALEIDVVTRVKL